ncbi:cathepsin d [Plakobranchus ocellatus]|uniref:Cathepsin d n=1 Tax=Plakobranchus ocellatus TaxID=259542 RepID=A0AAV3YPC0_9GAST|nr:cathepsin d [Plakobranchus ocellatus]
MNLTSVTCLLLTLIPVYTAQVMSLPFSPAKTVPRQHKNLGKRLEPHRHFRERFQRPMQPLSKSYRRPIRDFRVKATTAKDIKLENYYNNLYYAPITIGTPGQKFNVAFDIENPITWVPSIHSPSRQDRRISKKYNNESSSSFTANGKAFELSYPSGKVSGYFSQDNIAIAGATIHNQTFGEAILEPDMFSVSMNDGIFGLGFSDIAAGEEPTVLDNMVNKGILPAPVFSFYLNTYESHGPDSVLTLGGTNPEYYTGDFTFVQLSMPDRWQFEIDRIQMSRGVGTTCWYGCQAVVDPGSPFIAGPSYFVQVLNERIGAKPLEGNPKFYSVDHSQLDSLPDLELYVNGQKLTMTGKDYIVKFPEEQGGPYYSGLVGKDFKRDETAVWSLGTNFMRTYYTYFDKGNRRMGFAKTFSSLYRY